MVSIGLSTQFAHEQGRGVLDRLYRALDSGGSLDAGQHGRGIPA
jgi:hypothetical protein